MEAGLPGKPVADVARELRAWSWAYYTTRAMGEGEALREWLQLPEDFPIPLSVSHGIDFGHSYYPQDVKAPEPIHWAYNQTISELARHYKPAIHLPHPFLLRSSRMELPPGRGTLIIGPPPGPVNDERLFQLIGDRAHTGATILVKARGAYNRSLQFWRERGFAACTLGGVQKTDFYVQLAQTLARFEEIVGLTFSSALIYAAALKRRVTCLPGLRYRALEPRNYLSEVNFGSAIARQVVAAFLSGDQDRMRAVALERLGANFHHDPRARRSEFEAMVAAIRNPLWLDPAINFPPAAARVALARTLRKPGFINAGWRSYLSRVHRQELNVMEIDEFDVWMNGRNDGNFRLTPVSTGVGQRGGEAAEGYDE